MNTYLSLGGVVLFVLALAIIASALLYRRRLQRRTQSMRALIELAERLEGDLKTCRSELKRAYAVMSINPDAPTSGEQEAQQAVEAGLRALLQQRIWIRDRAAVASQSELDRAIDTFNDARRRLHPLQRALGQAQAELDRAIREHLQRGHEP
ncbi:MAG: hypothetical protein ABW154_11045 [Dyella sp.]